MTFSKYEFLLWMFNISFMPFTIVSMDLDASVLSARENVPAKNHVNYFGAQFLDLMVREHFQLGRWW